MGQAACLNLIKVHCNNTFDMDGQGLNTDLFLLCVMTGKKEGKSKVKSHGPFSAEASVSPSVLACWAASSRADLGKPSTCTKPERNLA